MSSDELMTEKTFIGVDLGGTTIAGGVVRGSDILALKTVPTRRERPVREIFDTITSVIRDVSKNYIIEGIGIGVPVPAGPGIDEILPCDNLPTMGNFPIRRETEKCFNLPVLLENDAECMTIGENRAGALQGCSYCACITLGTGLGFGLIFDGKLYRGIGTGAVEIWNFPFENGTTLEDSTAIRGLKSFYREMSGIDREPEEIYERFREGDPTAAASFDRYGEAVGRAAAMVLCILDLEKIAIGGGIARAYDAFREGMLRIVEKTHGKQAVQRIVPATLSDKAAIIGAAALVREKVV